VRLLVTNPQTPQAYAIIRALRPFAERVVTTLEPGGLRARFAHAAHSRLVDACYTVPSPVDDWSSGRAGVEPAAAERACVDQMLRIAARERLDVIFPSWDPYVCAVSRYKLELEAAGIVVPVPSFDIVLTALDKYRTIRAAEAVGFPCPRTWLYESLDQLRDVLRDESYPLVVKPRFTSGSRGLAIVRSWDELARVVPRTAAAYGAPMIQEYIPGGQRDSAQFVLDRQGRVVFAFHKKRLRTFRRTARLGTVSESAAPAERLARSAALLGRLAWWGPIGIEVIHDPRDGVDKLMEVNPRFPRQLWNRTEIGVNEPLLCLQIARGDAPPPVPVAEPGLLFVCPVEDLQLFALQIADAIAYAVRSRIAKRPELDETTRPASFRAQLSSFLASYGRRRKRVFDPYFRYFFQDPVAALLWWAEFSRWSLGTVKQVGR
jgi:biotin carboxylase